MRMRVLTTKLRVEIENEMRVEMRAGALVLASFQLGLPSKVPTPNPMKSGCQWGRGSGGLFPILQACF